MEKVNEVNVNFIDAYCPKCKSRLLTDGTKIFCSFVGVGAYYPPCDYVAPKDK